MTLENLVLILQSALKSSEISIIQNSNVLAEYLTKTAAYKRFGRSNVDRWIKEGLLKVSNKRINRASLESTAAFSYLPIVGRH